jgi:hypothetical protein
MTTAERWPGVDGRLLAFADRNGLVITSGRGGHHNVGSKHYRGEAIDVSVRHDRRGVPLSAERIGHLARDCGQHGLRLRDERTRPPGQAVWGGPHLHVEVASA